MSCYAEKLLKKDISVKHIIRNTLVDKKLFSATFRLRVFHLSYFK